jgi:hypothetical protein
MVRVMSELRFAGLDWASEEQGVCVVAQDGRIVEGRGYRHTVARDASLRARPGATNVHYQG